MNPTQYLRVMRRRWREVALAVGVSIGAGLVFSTLSPVQPAPQNYRATAILVNSENVFATGIAGITNLRALAMLTTVGEIPIRAGESLESDEVPLELAKRVQAVGDDQTGILRITATEASPGDAERLANAFANAVVGFLRDQKVQAASEEAQSVVRRMDELEEEIGDLDHQIAAAPASEEVILQSQRDAKVRQYGLLYESYQQIAASISDTGGLTLIQAAVAEPVEDPGLQPPSSRLSLLVLAAFLGLIAGLILVLVLDRFDTRVRTRQEAERHFGFPVLAEIPHIPRAKRQEIQVVADPKSSYADAFRVLATTVGLGLATSNGGTPASEGLKPRPRFPKTILVTSPGPADGKTTVGANLAAALAASGKRVIVLSCDLRRPRIHEMFGVPHSPGLAEVLSSPNGRVALDGHVLSTPVPRVWIVPSGTPNDRPGEMLSSREMQAAVEGATQISDVVLLDTPPILTASDAAHLIPAVDAVLVVARAGRTTQEVAERTSQLLKQLAVPAAAVTLNAAAEIAVPRRYHYYYYREQRRKAPGSEGQRKSGRVRDFFLRGRRP